MNNNFRTFAIGDIHGCFKTMSKLLYELGDWDRLIFLGDYIDRGPMSKDVIDFIISLQEFHGKDKVVALKGNHEDMCLHSYQYKDNYDRQLGQSWAYNGARQTLESFNSDPLVPIAPIPEEYLEWMDKLPLYYEDDNAYYVHAGFLPEVEPAKQDPYFMLWIRGDFIYSDYAWDKPVIFGHTPVKLVQDLGTKIAVDTGCCFGEFLSAYCVETKEVIKVKNCE